MVSMKNHLGQGRTQGVGESAPEETNSNEMDPTEGATPSLRGAVKEQEATQHVEEVLKEGPRLSPKDLMLQILKDETCDAPDLKEAIRAALEGERKTSAFYPFEENAESYQAVLRRISLDPRVSPEHQTMVGDINQGWGRGGVFLSSPMLLPNVRKAEDVFSKVEPWDKKILGPGKYLTLHTSEGGYMPSCAVALHPQAEEVLKSRMNQSSTYLDGWVEDDGSVSVYGKYSSIGGSNRLLCILDPGAVEGIYGIGQMDPGPALAVMASRPKPMLGSFLGLQLTGAEGNQPTAILKLQVAGEPKPAEIHMMGLIVKMAEAARGAGWLQKASIRVDPEEIEGRLFSKTMRLDGVSPNVGDIQEWVNRNL